MSRFSQIVPAVVMLLASSSVCGAQKARAYYDELYKAAGLDRVSAQYVCFDEDPENENFFIFSTSDALRASFVEKKQYDSLPAGSKALFNKGFLYVRGYSKGVPLGDEDDQYMKSGESWLSDPFIFNKTTTGRMRFRISFDTLRYRRSVEVIKDRATREAVARFGKCEPIPADIHQTGK